MKTGGQTMSAGVCKRGLLYSVIFAPQMVQYSVPAGMGTPHTGQMISSSTS